MRQHADVNLAQVRVIITQINNNTILPALPHSCTDIRTQTPTASNGVYTIYPTTCITGIPQTCSQSAVCQMTASLDGSTLDVADGVWQVICGARRGEFVGEGNLWGRGRGFMALV